MATQGYPGTQIWDKCVGLMCLMKFSDKNLSILLEIANLATWRPCLEVESPNRQLRQYIAHFFDKHRHTMLLNSHKHLWMGEGGFGVNRAPSMPPKKVREL